MRTHLALLLAALTVAPALAQQPAVDAASAAQVAPSSVAKTQSSVFSPTRALATAAIGVPQAASAAGFQSGQAPVAPTLATPVAASAPSLDGPHEVPAVFVGKVNGMNVYRANGGYLFESSKRPTSVPKETGSVADTSTAAVTPPMPGLTKK